MTEIILIDTGQKLEVAENPALQYDSNLFVIDDLTLSKTLSLEIPPTPNNEVALGFNRHGATGGSIMRKEYYAEMRVNGVPFRGWLYISEWSDGAYQATFTFGELYPIKTLSNIESFASWWWTGESIEWSTGNITYQDVTTSDGDTYSCPVLGVIGYYITNESSGDTKTTGISGVFYDVIYAYNMFMAFGTEQILVSTSDDASQWEIAYVDSNGRECYSAAVSEDENYLVFALTSDGIMRVYPPSSLNSLYMSTGILFTSTGGRIKFGSSSSYADFACVSQDDSGSSIYVRYNKQWYELSLPSIKDTSSGLYGNTWGTWVDCAYMETGDAWVFFSTSAIITVSGFKLTSGGALTGTFDVMLLYMYNTSGYISGIDVSPTRFGDKGSFHSQQAVTTDGAVVKLGTLNEEWSYTDTDGTTHVGQRQYYGYSVDYETGANEELYGYDTYVSVGADGTICYQDDARDSGVSDNLYGVCYHDGIYVAVGDNVIIYSTTSKAETWSAPTIYVSTADDGTSEGLLPIPSVNLAWLLCGGVTTAGASVQDEDNLYSVSISTADLETLSLYWVTLPSVNNAYGVQLSAGSTVYLKYNAPDITPMDVVKICAAILGKIITVTADYEISYHDYYWTASGSQVLELNEVADEGYSLMYSVGEDGAQSNTIGIDGESDSPVTTYTTDNVTLSDESELYEIPIDRGTSYYGAPVFENVEADQDDDGNVTYTYGGDSYIAKYTGGLTTADNTLLTYIASINANGYLQAIYTKSVTAIVPVKMSILDFYKLGVDTLAVWRSMVWLIQTASWEAGSAEVTLVALPSEDYEDDIDAPAVTCDCEAISAEDAAAVVTEGE